MSLVTALDIGGNTEYALQAALGAYSHEAYTNARKLTGTGVVSSNPNIDKGTETYIGQMRWFKPLVPEINIASLSDDTAGTVTTFASDFLTYIKTVRTHGATKVNMSSLVTGVDGLAKVGRDFGETRSQDEHNAILSILKGVAISEVLRGTTNQSGATGLGGQTFDNDPTDARGFYVDLGSAKAVIANDAANQGAIRAQGFLDAFGKGFKDYEPEYAYLCVSPETVASLRGANLVDQDGVTEGNITFSTIFNGKFRLIPTRANQGFSFIELAKLNTGTGVDLVGTKCSFIILPGSIAMENLDVPDATEIGRDAASYQGGGSTSIWYRWGYVGAPAGYDWAGPQTAFPSDADYMKLTETTQKTLATITAADDAVSNWTRKAASTLTLGILPVFHA